MVTGPFKTGKNGSLFYVGNRVSQPIDDVRIFKSPDLSSRHIELRNNEHWKNIMIIYDDRINVTMKDKVTYSDFLGVKEKVIVGKREASSNVLSIKSRGVKGIRTQDLDTFLSR